MARELQRIKPVTVEADELYVIATYSEDEGYIMQSQTLFTSKRAADGLAQELDAEVVTLQEYISEKQDLPEL